LRTPYTGTRTGACLEAAVLTVFLVTPPHLREILNGLNWKIYEAHDVRDVVKFLSARRPPVILCHCSFAGGSWKDILEHISVLPHPPQLIVTSETADDVLWAEVLNLGGYDVIAQPFWEPEVARTLSSALRRWEQETAHAKS
jgi:DNA-binding response OmpR family regulator